MPLVEVDAAVAELALLDVVDLQPDGTVRLNESFLEACLAAYDADPSCLDEVFHQHILARATERGYAGCVDLDNLALAALEVGAGERAQPPS